MHGLAWIAVNVMSWKCDVIFIGCSCTRKLAQCWYSLVNSNHDYCFFAIWYSRYFMFWTHNSAKNSNRSLILTSWPRTVFSVTSPQLICDVTRTSIVTPCSSIVLARANWREGDLHWWITPVNIDFSPPGINGLACKKYMYIYIYIYI